MKRLLLTSVAALFLATGTVHAEEKLDNPWWPDCRRSRIVKMFNAELLENNPPVMVGPTVILISLDELRKLLKDLPNITRAFKACDAYRKCLVDREIGKVKHCYENDRRWREFFAGDW
jgi:hypothetical protein